MATALEHACPRCARSLASTQKGDWCTSCGGFWITAHALEERIRAFLAERGHSLGIIPLHEMPGGISRFDCAPCGTTMSHVKFRGVELERCDSCQRMFLSGEAVTLISQRVLSSAQHPLTEHARMTALVTPHQRQNIVH